MLNLFELKCIRPALTVSGKKTRFFSTSKLPQYLEDSNIFFYKVVLFCSIQMLQVSDFGKSTSAKSKIALKVEVIEIYSEFDGFWYWKPMEMIRKRCVSNRSRTFSWRVSVLYRLSNVIACIFDRSNEEIMQFGTFWKICPEICQRWANTL